jgi:hypothetical protein
MEREVRMVPKDWQHPKGFDDEFVPLHDRNFRIEYDKWIEAEAKWRQGLTSDHEGGWEPIEEKYRHLRYKEYAGPRPDPDDYMPEWKPGEANWLMMYETCSEGTPISPAFETPEQLARWLTDNNASAFGSMTADYDCWLRVARGGFAPSSVYSPSTGMVSGVEGIGGSRE